MEWRWDWSEGEVVEGKGVPRGNGVAIAGARVGVDRRHRACWRSRSGSLTDGKVWVEGRNG